MRPFGTIIHKKIKFREPSIPGARRDRVTPHAERRLDEGIYELFEHACITSDLEATLVISWR